MKVKKDEIISEFNLYYWGAKGWMKNDSLSCPECGKAGKFGIKFSDNFGAVHCFKCDYSQNIVSYLEKINRKDLIAYSREVNLKGLIEPIFNKEEDPIVYEFDFKYPLGFEHITKDEYLDNRGFKDFFYEEFNVGITNHFLENKLKGYIIFIIKMNGEPISWLARSKNSKEWHEENLNKFKERKVTLFPRYINSPGTDFDKILGGYDNITNNTHTVVIVEGLFDYINLSNLLKTNLYEEIKVIFTFGNKISDNQINLLRKKKSVKSIILMYDYNTIKQSKRYSLLLSKYYDVDICEIKDPDVDPGNMSESYLSDLLINKKNFLYFYTSKI